jgi:hypothetical protein
MLETNTGQRKKVSQFSATQIGAIENVGNRKLIRDNFKDESKVVLSHLKVSHHHAAKDPHLQVFYPDTCKTLSAGMRAQDRKEFSSTFGSTGSSVLSGSGGHTFDHPTTRFQSSSASYPSKYDDYVDRMKADIHSEHNLNHRKRAFNHASGTKSILKDVFKGTLPLTKQNNCLFPQKATHQQLLALTGALSMPSAHTIPPPVAVKKRWGGDDVGWLN